MDEFGVLTERFGLKPQGKSAPMSASRGPNNTQTRNFPSSNTKSNSYSSKSTYNSNSYNGFYMDDHRTLSSNSKPQNFGDDFDIFGGFQKNSKQTSTGFFFDIDSMFSSTKSSSVQSSFVDDIFGGLNGSSSLVNNNDEDDDIFEAFTSSSKAAKQNDLLGGSDTKLKPPSRNGSVGFDDLIPGLVPETHQGKSMWEYLHTIINLAHYVWILVGMALLKWRANWSSFYLNLIKNMHTTTPTFTSSEDPFVVLEQTSTTTKSFIEFGKFNHSGRTEPAVSSNCSPPLRPPPKPGHVLKTGKDYSVSLN
ncbi:hypothetical protein DKX38_008130 [Salix brachista]|uniref:Uncharacterized protein n=1 Tax=Salix brachista TaxID=2182728 RepID=A0A5N5MSH4_9ROSI|nr:hypothetical protein DKX38_008130 [Salix brachista]